MEEHSPILKEMASEPLAGKPLAFYSEVGPKSAIAWTQDEFCLFSAESGHSHSKVISFSNLVGLSESSGAWTLTIREGHITRPVTLSSQAAYQAKLGWTMDQLKRAQEQACPSAPLKLESQQQTKPQKNEQAALGAFLVLIFIPGFFFFCLWLFWPAATTPRRSTEVGTPHTWPGYDTADHSNDCLKCGAKLSSRTDSHDCEALQRMNKSEGWIDGVYGPAET